MICVMILKGGPEEKGRKDMIKSCKEEETLISS